MCNTVECFDIGQQNKETLRIIVFSPENYYKFWSWLNNFSRFCIIHYCYLKNNTIIYVYKYVCPFDNLCITHFEDISSKNYEIDLFSVWLELQKLSCASIIITTM